MDNWEEEYQKQAAREDALYRRKLAQLQRRRERRRRLTMFAASLALFVLVTAVLAVVSANRPEEPRGSGPSGSGQGGPSDASGSGAAGPEEIVLPDWIEVDLLPLNEYSRPGTPLEEVNGVVVHYVGNPNTTAKQNRSYFANLATTHETSASSHFLVGLEGEILLIVPLEEISYCSTIRNHDTIAIECCHPDETGKFNEKTTESLVKLLKWLCDTYNLDREDVIRHYDVAGKICPKYYVDHPDAWEELRDRVFA